MAIGYTIFHIIMKKERSLLLTKLSELLFLEFLNVLRITVEGI